MVVASEVYGQPAEHITVPVKATSEIVNGNNHAARQRAIAKAFQLAVWLAAAGVTPSSEMEHNKKLIQKNLLANATSYVLSYKFLENTIDPINGNVLVRLQVTLSLDTIRKILSSLGIKAKSRKLPKLVVVIKESKVGTFTDSNFLILTSLTEEVLTSNFKRRGYEVVDRSDITDAGFDKLLFKAMEGNIVSIVNLATYLKADILILGSADVTVTPSSKGEVIGVTINVTIRNGSNGNVMTKKSKSGSGILKDILAGSLHVKSTTAHNLFSSLVRSVASIWQEIEDNANSRKNFQKFSVQDDVR